MSLTQSARGGRWADAQRDLLASIQQKRADVEVYLGSAVSRRRMLLNVTIIAGACAASLTAAPALGGKSLTDWLAGTFGLSSPAWQLLCALAAACSLAATVATQLLKSHNLEEHIACARSVRARLETLEVGIATRRLTDADAASEYRKCIEGVAFIQRPRRIRAFR